VRVCSMHVRVRVRMRECVCERECVCCLHVPCARDRARLNVLAYIYVSDMCFDILIHMYMIYVSTYVSHYHVYMINVYLL